MDHAVSNGVTAAVAPGAVVLGEARHAVHAAVVLVELGAVDGLLARVAREVLRVPFLVQRCHDSSFNRCVAAATNDGRVGHGVVVS